MLLFITSKLSLILRCSVNNQYLTTLHHCHNASRSVAKN